MSNVLASCSNIILTHDLSSSAPVYRLQPHSSKINCVTWNHNSRVLGSCGDDGMIVLSLPQNGERLAAFDSHEAKPMPANSISFSSKSEHLAIGFADGLVKIWDLRKKELTATFRSHSDSVTCVTWNQSDSHIASASLSGDIILHSLVTSVSVATLRQRSSLGIKLIQFSPLKKQLLGAASENGSIYVWDTNARSIVSQFPTLHSSPVTGLAFSPVNEALLCSTGLDQRIHFFDIRKNKLVQTLEADAPITSLAFCGDGHTIAIGSLYGTIQAMDLRNDKQGRLALRGHEGNSVNWMEFVKQSNREAKHIPSRNVTPTAQKVNPPDIKDDTLITKPEFRSIEEIRMFARNRVEEKKKLVQRPAEQVVSTPVSPINPVTTFTPTPSNGIPPSPPPPQPVTAKPTPLDTSQRFSNISNLSGSSAFNGFPGPMSQSEEFKPAPRSLGENSPIKDIVASTISNSISEFRTEMQTCQEAVLESVHDLHIELIRQFTIQQAEMASLLDKYASDNSQLLKRIKELESENDDLKKKSY